MMQLPDAPDIACALRTGYPHSNQLDPICPICGHACADVYYNPDGYVVGCDGCVTVRDAWDADECFLNA